MNLPALAALLLLLPAAAPASEIGFEPGQTLDARAVVDQARASASQSDLEGFLRALGDAEYAGTSGALVSAGERYSLVETRALVRQKARDGAPGASLRLYTRAAKDSNPSHVEASSLELDLEARDGRLVVARDGKPDQEARLTGPTGAAGLTLVYRKLSERYRPDVVETLGLSLKNGALCVERVDAVSGVETERQTYCAARR